MRKLTILILSMIFIVSGFTSLYADDGGMDEWRKDRGSMMESGMKETGGMIMQGREMSDSMTQRANQMVDITQKMSMLIGKGYDTSNRKELTEVMKTMSAHMKDMYKIMKKGKVSQKDMQKLQQKMMDTDKRLNMMNQ